ncbi:MAG: signal peptide peptidase SppA [Myxococcota bacterium]
MRRLLAVLLVTLVAGVIFYVLIYARPQIPESSVLVLELGGRIEEAPALDALEQLLARGPALPTLVLQLEKAAADDRIEAVLLHVRGLEANYARIQELRDAVRRVRETKPVIALLDLMSLNATRELYLASSASKLYLVPGFLGPFAGIAGQYLTLGGFLEKLGIRLEYERIGRYKSAPETLAERELSDDALEVFNELLDGLFAQIVRGVAEGRSLEPRAVRRLIDNAPSTAEEYLASGLADGVAGRSEVLELAGFEDVEEVSYETYLGIDPRELGLRDGPPIALIFGDGSLVQSGRGGPRSRAFEADVVEQALKDAAEDEDVRAIVLRVNSPGGSPLASDQLWRAVREARKKKPVVVSMGDAAASGGYYVASAADAILAHPATLTGSIGVFFLHPALADLYRKLEIGSEVLTRGPFAPVAIGAEPFTKEQRERTRGFVAAVYRDFVDRVATGRGLEAADVDRVGQGHVWLGEMALGHGLVDELGGLRSAVKRAQSEAGLDLAVDPERVIFPGPRPLTEQVIDLLRGDLPHALTSRLLPIELPPIVQSVASLAEGELAYLPTYWIEIR